MAQLCQEERHELMQVLDVVTKRRKLDGAREELQQASQVGLHGALAERDGNPEDLLPACGQRLLQRYPQRMQPQDAEPVDVPDDQAPLPLEQFTETPQHPVVVTGIGGVQHTQSASRAPAPTDSPQQRQLAGSGLALQRQPLPDRKSTR